MLVGFKNRDRMAHLCEMTSVANALGKSMNIEYRVNDVVSTEQFVTLLKNSTLGERRPVDDLACIAGMIENSNLVVSAWDGEQLVGVSRCMTDFHYACYLSDLAVSKTHQGSGIGKQLQRLTQDQLGPKCKLILIAAPAAHSYYEHIGFSRSERCWLLGRDARIGS